jgi:hypothetical protein
MTGSFVVVVVVVVVVVGMVEEVVVVTGDLTVTGMAVGCVTIFFKEITFPLPVGWPILTD